MSVASVLRDLMDELNELDLRNPINVYVSYRDFWRLTAAEGMENVRGTGPFRLYGPSTHLNVYPDADLDEQPKVVLAKITGPWDADGGDV